MTTPNKAISIAILAMGGEGGGVLADWIVDLAEQAGCHAQTTSVPGVAQRTGATIYYVEIYPAAHKDGNEPCRAGDACAQQSPPPSGKVAGEGFFRAPSRAGEACEQPSPPPSGRGAGGGFPVLSLMPVPGHVDIVIASELMEAGRAIQRGLVTQDRTTLIASTHRVYSMIEKMAMGDGRVDSQKLIEAAAAAARRFIHTDFARLAQQSGSVISAALFGALAGAALLPFSRADFEAAIRRGGVGIDASLAAFAAGFDHVDHPDTAARAASHATPRPGPALAHVVKRIETTFPAGSHALLHAAIIRLADYQDVAYAEAFLDDLEPVLRLDAAPYDLLRETARHLALWMSYHDAIRVASLKIRGSRFARIARDVDCRQGQLLEIDDFFHPRIEEIADIMPAGLGRWLRKSAFLQRSLTGGRTLKTASIRGYLQLWAVAGLRRWRRTSLRFHAERQRIVAWLDLIQSTAPVNHELAIALAKSQKLLKGYGDTQQRGSNSFEAIRNALAHIQTLDKPAAVMERLIQAALADENGQALKKALSEL